MMKRDKTCSRLCTMQKHQWRTNDVGLSIYWGKTDSQSAGKILSSTSGFRRMSHNKIPMREGKAGLDCWCCGLSNARVDSGKFSHDGKSRPEKTRLRDGDVVSSDPLASLYISLLYSAFYSTPKPTSTSSCSPAKFRL